MRLRKHRSGFAIAGVGLAALLLALPATASADHRDRRGRAEMGHRYHGHHEVRRARDHHRGHRNERVAYRAVRRHEAWRHHHHRGFARHRAAPFYCKPCRHRFASRDGFHRHVRHHHHVAPWRLPRVIIHHALGWVFFG